MGVLFHGPGISSASHLWMRRMVRGLGDDVAVLSTTRPCEDQFPDVGTVLLLESDDVVPGPFRRALTRRHNGRRLAEAVDGDAVSVVLVHFATEADKYARVWRASKKPVYVHCHGWDVTWEKHHRSQTLLSRLIRGRYADRVRELSRECTFIVNSTFTRQKLTGIGISEDRIRQKPLGVPVPYLCPVTRVGNRPRRFLFLGRLVACKGPTLTIEAFERACEMGLDGRLIVAGDGPRARECRGRLSSSPVRDRVDLVGEVTEEEGERLREWADVFTAHNRTDPATGQEEAFGVAFLEAMAAGLPVVTGSSGGVPEVIRNGKEGRFFEPGDVEAHAEHLLSLAQDEDERMRLGRNAWKRIRRDFSLEAEIDRLRSILGLR